MLDIEISDISTEQQQVINAADVFSVQPHMSHFLQLFSTAQYSHSTHTNENILHQATGGIYQDIYARYSTSKITSSALQ